jgi:HAD superfamily hydrolase (TIGR01549 family)
MIFPRAVFLDVGWTLVYPRLSLWDVLAEIIDRAGGTLDAGEVERIVHSLMMGRRDQAIEEFRSGASYEDSDEAFRGIFFALGQVVFRMAGIESDPHALTEHTLRRFWALENWAVFPDVVPAIRRLRERGVRVLALSNASSELVTFLEQIGLAPYLNPMIVSAIEGTRKPDRRIFQRALDRAGVTAGQAVHVGDMYVEDVLGASGLGIRPYLIDRGPCGMFPGHPETVPEEAAAHTEIVRSLDDVLTALEQRP